MLAREIVRRLEHAGLTWPGGADNARIRRLRPGRWQRKAGAWSWMLVAADGSYQTEVGSDAAARVVVRDGWQPKPHCGCVVFEPPRRKLA